MTSIWVVLVEDRHFDAEVLPFSSEGRAIEEARAQVAAHAAHPERVNWDGLKPEMRASGCVFLATFGDDESESVSVVKRTLDSDP